MTTKTKKPQVVRLADILRDEESQKLLGETIAGLVKDHHNFPLDAALKQIEDRAPRSVPHDWGTEIDHRIDARIETKVPTRTHVTHWGPIIAIAILGLLGATVTLHREIEHVQRDVAAIQKAIAMVGEFPTDLERGQAIAWDAAAGKWEPVARPSGTGTVNSDMPTAGPVTFPAPVLYVTAGDKACWLRVTDLDAKDGSILYEGTITARAPFNLIAGETYEVRDGCPGSLSFDAQGTFPLTADELKNLSGRPDKSEVLHIKP